jgi:hypothetical protein
VAVKFKNAEGTIERAPAALHISSKIKELDLVAEALISELGVDGFFLGYDERSAGPSRCCSSTTAA